MKQTPAYPLLTKEHTKNSSFSQRFGTWLVSICLLLLLCAATALAHHGDEQTDFTICNTIATLSGYNNASLSYADISKTSKHTFLGETLSEPAKEVVPELRRLHCYWEIVQKLTATDSSLNPATKAMGGELQEIWSNIMREAPAMEPEEQLRSINGFFNGWRSRTDNYIYKVREYWATPHDFITNRGGDCEDYTIIKYYALRNLGWPPESLWIILLVDMSNFEGHAILATKTPEGKIFFLDNLAHPALMLIPEKMYSKRFAPMYALNENGMWAFSQSILKVREARKKNTKQNRITSPAAKKS